MRGCRRRLLLVALACLAASGDRPGRAADAASPAAPDATPGALRGAVGLELAPGEGGAAFVPPPDLRSPEPGDPCVLLLAAGRDALLDPARLESLLREVADAHLRIVIRLTDEGWGPANLAADAWVGAVGDLARRLVGRVSAYQVLDQPAGRYDPLTYAYLLKRAAVVIRAADRNALIVAGGLRAGDLDWATRLLQADAAPYLDVLAAQGPAALKAVVDLRDRLDPQEAVWLVSAPLDREAPRPSAAAIYLEGISEGAQVVLLAPAGPPAEETGGPALPPLLTDLRSMITPDMASAAPAALPFDPAGAALPAGTRLRVLPFFDAGRRTGIAAYRLEEAATGTTPIRLTLRAPLRTLDLYDPGTGAGSPLGDRLPAGAIVEVPARADLLLLRYRFAAAALPVQEELHVGATSELTAEEIIAREREFNAAQKARLTHYEAHASVAIHYRIAAVAESVDLTSENRLYVHDGKQDYVQTALYLDGARWRGKTPPYLPFLQPEKVKEVPLDIALDEGYRYTLLGRDTVEGRDCYVLGFEPMATDRSLYSGKVYIDRQLFARVRMEAVQNGLTPPLRSNAVDYTFGPVLSPEGTFWLPLRVTGQMVFEVLGQNLVVERRATYSQFVINGQGFDLRLTEAYGSGQPVFRETDQGYFRLDTTGGEQRLTSASVPRNVFLVMGVDSGLDGHPGLPFAGVNFFDFNHKGSGHQVNIAWAGPFLDLSWTNPLLRQSTPDRRPWAVSLEATLNGLKGRDKNARATGTNSGETIDDLRESARAALGIPMGHFAKWTLQGTATYFNFARRSETDDAFVLPPIFTEGSLLLRLEYNRAGYIATAWGEAARRSTWRPWGLPGNPFSPDDRDYTRLGTSFVKAFYLGSFRKLTLALTGFEGRGLDRFSRFELGDFRSARVNGFNGAGIHFDRGLVAEPACSFTLRKTMRFDAAMQVGWVHGEQDFGPGYERVIGGVVGAQFSGPWSTLGMVRVSHGLSSTIPGKGRGGDVRVVFFKTFDRWSRKGH